MKHGKVAAQRGKKGEETIIDWINNNKKQMQTCIEKLLEFNTCIGKLFSPHKEIMCAHKCSDKRAKTDIIIILKPDRKQIGLSLKTTQSKSNFNQLDRRWVEDWINILHKKECQSAENLKRLQQILTESILAKAYNRSGPLIKENDKALLTSLITPCLPSIIEYAFKDEDDILQLFGIYNTDNQTLIIFRIDDVIRTITLHAKVNYTKAGTIQILEDIVTIQRKGGNGRHVKLPKTDPKHPGNQLQIKIKPISLAEFLKANIKHKDYCLIKIKKSIL